MGTVFRSIECGLSAGRIFNLSYKFLDPVVADLVQAQFDNRERYRIISGIQLIFGSTLQEWQRPHIPTPVAASAGGIKTARTRLAPLSGSGNWTGVSKE